MYRGLSYARKSEVIFFTLDDVRLLRDFPEEGSLKIQVKKIEEKTAVFQIYYIDCGRRLLLRGGRTEGFRRHPSASTGFRWSLADMINCCLRTFLPISRAVLHKP